MRNPSTQVIEGSRSRQSSPKNQILQCSNIDYTEPYKSITQARGTAMNIKIHYRITQDRAGIPQEYSGARHFVVSEGDSIEEMARKQLATDYQVPHSAVEICHVES
jgi:hypothetical protein